MNNIAEIHENVYAHLTDNYPELRFTLRKINRGGRFDQGYWFTGTDGYLVFSFWQGLDWKKQDPSHFFPNRAKWRSDPQLCFLRK